MRLTISPARTVRSTRSRISLGPRRSESPATSARTCASRPGFGATVDSLPLSAAWAQAGNLDSLILNFESERLSAMGDGLGDRLVVQFGGGTAITAYQELPAVRFVRVGTANKGVHRFDTVY